MKFKVGDRVAYYSDEGRSVATVRGYKPFERGMIKLEDGQRIFFAHKKQCRRLKPKAKKEPQEIWVNFWDSDSLFPYCYPTKEKAKLSAKNFDDLKATAVKFVRAEE